MNDEIISSNLVYLHWIPLLALLSVLLPPSQISINLHLNISKTFKKISSNNKR